MTRLRVPSSLSAATPFLPCKACPQTNPYVKAPVQVESAALALSLASCKNRLDIAVIALPAINKMIETTCLNDEKKTDDLPPSLLKREETVGAGLDQLDVITDKLVRHRASSVDKAELPPQKPSQGISLVDAAFVL